jgi:hypothetical protein
MNIKTKSESTANHTLPQNNPVAFDLSPTDAINDERGAPREGEPIAEPMTYIAPHIVWGDIAQELSDAGEEPMAETEIAFPEQPDGWIRDSDGDLWPHGAIDGLRVSAVDCDGVRHRLQALTPEGWRTVEQQRNRQDVVFAQYALAYRISANNAN